MIRRSLFLILFSFLSLTSCSDKQKAKEQAELDAALLQHCQTTAAMSLEAYTQKYMLHNGNTERDRQAAVKDYRDCKKRLEGGVGA